MIKKRAETQTTAQAGFLVKNLPDATGITIWFGDVEMVASLTRDQAARLSRLLAEPTPDVFVGAQKITRFDVVE